MSVPPQPAGTRRVLALATGNVWLGATTAATPARVSTRTQESAMAQKNTGKSTSSKSGRTQVATGTNKLIRLRGAASTERATQGDAQPSPPMLAETKNASTSALDAAHAVLASEGTPMNVRAITKAIFAKKLWTTRGKTPHATIAAGIMREIARKGTASHFVKADRGLFAAREGATTKATPDIARSRATPSTHHPVDPAVTSPTASTTSTKVMPKARTDSAGRKSTPRTPSPKPSVATT